MKQTEKLTDRVEDIVEDAKPEGARVEMSG